MTAPVLSTRVLNRTLLARQHLLSRASMPALEMIEHLAGLQAQEPKDPYVALWSRVEGFEPAELESLLVGRQAVRSVLMRSTVHLASIDDALAFRPVVQPVLDWELFRNKTWSVGLEGVDLEPVLELGRRLMEERPRSLAELRAAMSERFPDRDATTLAYACRGRLPTLQVPPRGLWSTSGQVRLTTLDHWSGRPVATETEPDAMILRYLAAFGPASTSDVAAWSRLTGLKEPMERLRPRLRVFRDERGRELFDLPDAPIADPDVPAPVRFFPSYDNLFLSHADRTRVIPEAMRAAPIRTQITDRVVHGRRVRDRVLVGEGCARRAGDQSRADAAPERSRAAIRRGRGARAVSIPRGRSRARAGSGPLGGLTGTARVAPRWPRDRSVARRAVSSASGVPRDVPRRRTRRSTRRAARR